MGRSLEGRAAEAEKGKRRSRRWPKGTISAGRASGSLGIFVSAKPRNGTGDGEQRLIQAAHGPDFHPDEGGKPPFSYTMGPS